MVCLNYCWWFIVDLWPDRSCAGAHARLMNRWLFAICGFQSRKYPAEPIEMQSTENVPESGEFLEWNVWLIAGLGAWIWVLLSPWCLRTVKIYRVYLLIISIMLIQTNTWKIQNTKIQILIIQLLPKGDEMSKFKHNESLRKKWTISVEWAQWLVLMKYDEYVTCGFVTWVVQNICAYSTPCPKW